MPLQQRVLLPRCSSGAWFPGQARLSALAASITSIIGTSLLLFEALLSCPDPLERRARVACRRKRNIGISGAHSHAGRKPSFV